MYIVDMREWCTAYWCKSPVRECYLKLSRNCQGLAALNYGRYWRWLPQKVLEHLLTRTGSELQCLQVLFCLAIVWFQFNCLPVLGFGEIAFS